MHSTACLYAGARALSGTLRNEVNGVRNMQDPGHEKIRRAKDTFEWWGLRELVELVDPAAAKQRRGESAGRIEDKGQGFQEEVARAMRHYAQTHPAAELVHGEGSADEVAARIMPHVHGLRVGPS